MPTIPISEPISTPRISPQRLVQLTAALSAVAGLLFGYDTGLIAGAQLHIVDDFHLNDAQLGIVVSAVTLGALFGAIGSSAIADRYDRKTIVMWSAIVFIVGALGAALAPSFEVLVVARLVIGLAIGFASTIVPLYIAEIAPVRNRGSLIAMFQLAITAGILVSYLMNAVLRAEQDWRVVFALATIPALLLGIGMLFLPRSPRWLVLVKRDDEARGVLGKIRDVTVDDVDNELDAIKETAARPKLPFRALFGPTVRPIVVVGVGLGIFQQITGINTIIYYAGTIFSEAGLGDSTAILTTAGIGALNFVMTVIALLVVDRFSRRGMLLAGMAGMLAAQVALALAFALAGGFGDATPDFTGALQYLAVGAVAVFIACFAVTWGWGFWVMYAEIFPLNVRGQAMSLSNTVQWGANFALSLVFPILLGALGGAPVFGMLAVFCVIGLLFTYRLLPETKGKSLEEVEEMWNERTGASQPQPT